MLDQTSTSVQVLVAPMTWPNRQVWALSALVIVACALPLVLSNYYLFQLTVVMSNAIALLGLNLLTGYNGQVSLGHGAFYAIGAYTAAILMTSFGIPYWAAVPCAGAVCFVTGFLFGLPALRLDGLYLALATFALGMCLPQLLKYKHFERWTGGVQGIVLVKPEPPLGLAISSDQWLYWLAFLVTAIMFVAARNLIHGHVGRAIIAIREQPVAAAAMGIDVARYKSLTFGVSVLYTGVAGALAALTVQFVAPDSFLTPLSIALLVGVVVGGLGSISGAIYGALFIQFIPNVANQISTAAPGAVFGVLMIACAYLMPAGIAGFVKRIKTRLLAPPSQP